MSDTHKAFIMQLSMQTNPLWDNHFHPNWWINGRSRAGGVVDRSMLGLNDDVTCFGPVSLEREHPLGADKRGGLCLVLQTLIYHFRWSQRSFVGLWVWRIILLFLHRLVGGIKCALFLYRYGFCACMERRLKDLGCAGKEDSLCVSYEKRREGWCVEGRWGKTKTEGERGKHMWPWTQTSHKCHFFLLSMVLFMYWCAILEELACLCKLCRVPSIASCMLPVVTLTLAKCKASEKQPEKIS